MFEILVLRSNFYSSFTTLDSWTFNEMGKSACILRWTSFPRSFKSLSISKLEKTKPNFSEDIENDIFNFS